MANQTAVECLVKTITDKYDKSFTEFYGAEIEQAKAMEKEQIIHAYWNGTTDMEKQDALNDAEKFYNEYYKN